MTYDKIKKPTPWVLASHRDPEGIRTPDRLLRRQMLYPTELRDQKNTRFKVQCSFLEPSTLNLVVVGVAGFEPTTSCSQSRRDTGLRYTPNSLSPYLSNSVSVSAERGGFEPPVPITQYDSLANCWFQPLTHLSGWAQKI